MPASRDVVEKPRAQILRCNECNAAIAFSAAIRESLRQNRDCASKCSASDIKKVGQLKDAALAKLNPLLKPFGFGPYTSKQI